MRIQSAGHLLSAFALAAGAGLLAGTASASDFYAGKTLTMVIGSGAGGGYDRYGRVVGKYMAKHIPGNPTLVPRNMPGAGSVKAAEFLFSLAPKDGTHIGIVQPGALVEPLFNSTRQFGFEPPKYEAIGSANSGTRLCVTFHTSKVKSMEDAMKIESTVGGNAPGSATTDYSLMLNNLAGTKFKVVNGYDTTAKVVLAMERGEVDGVCGFDTASLASQRPDWYGTKLTHMIVQVGLTPDPDVEKLGAPSIWKYVTGRNRDVAELILAQQEFHRTFLAPPGTPAEQVAILRDAFDKAMVDPEFLAEAKKSKLDIAPKKGQFVGDLIKKIYNAPKDLVESAQKSMGR